MGEGWLLTAEMMELVEIGYSNIVCAQPFGCLPNHICGKGVMKKIKQLHPDANIIAIDYDPSATKVNQDNRIKLMLAIAREKIKEGEKVKL
jgi:predicted nucleotide-binding protein (sugar kinase/HSP70/actin superfamily)